MIKYIFILISLTVLLVLQIHNIISFPVNRGFDIAAHIGYIDFIKNNHRVPLPTQGYEMYQPPLYYYLASLFPSLISTRIINLLSYLLIMVSAYSLIKYLKKNTFLSFAGAILVGSLPITIYLTPPISNEFFTASIISLTLVWYILNYRHLTPIKLIFLGCLLGLCLLSKMTALALLVVILIDLARHERTKIVIPLTVILLVCGWFYFRNYWLYKNPFVVNTDFPQYAINHSPAISSLRYFINPIGFVTLDLFNAHHYSFWAGTYFSWFYDGHNMVVPVQSFSKIGIILIIFSIIILSSFFNGLAHTISRPSRVGFIMIIYLIIIFAAYILFVIKIANYYAVKSSYIASALIPFVYFVIKGIERFKKYYSIVYSYLLIYSLLILKAFWILPGWYK